MNLEPIEDEVLRELPWLFEDRGFRVVRNKQDAEAFGNSLVTLESADLRLEFMRDMGEAGIQVAGLPTPETWWATWPEPWTTPA